MKNEVDKFLMCLAERVAARIFTCYGPSGGTVADRIDLRRGDTVAEETSLGGLCMGAARDRIYDELRSCLDLAPRGAHIGIVDDSVSGEE